MGSRGIESFFKKRIFREKKRAGEALYLVLYEFGVHANVVDIGVVGLADHNIDEILVSFTEEDGSNQIDLVYVVRPETAVRPRTPAWLGPLGSRFPLAYTQRTKQKGQVVKVGWKGGPLADQLNDDVELCSTLAGAQYPDIDILSKQGGKEIWIAPKAPVAIPGLSHQGDHKRESFTLSQFSVYEVVAWNIRELATERVDNSASNIKEGS